MSELNDKQERFSQAYVLHSNATEAAKAAGYSESSAYNQGYRLLQQDKVKERIEDLQKESFTTVNVVAELETLVAEGGDATKIKALELLSKVRGTKSDQDVEKNEDELHADIVSALNIIGADETLALIEQCDWWESEADEAEYDEQDEEEDGEVEEEV